jgi:hypothetical protein
LSRPIAGVVAYGSVSGLPTIHELVLVLSEFGEMASVLISHISCFLKHCLIYESFAQALAACAAQVLLVRAPVAP